MIDNLLKRLYPIQCGVARDRLDRIDVDIEVAAGSVNLNDSKACDECLRLRPYRKACVETGHVWSYIGNRRFRGVCQPVGQHSSIIEGKV